jgi:hypothetical protein
LLLLAGCGYFFGLLVSRTTYSVVQSDRFNSTQFMDLTNYEMNFYVTNGLGERIPDAYRVFGVTGLFFFYDKQLDADGKISMKMTAKPVKMEQCNLTRHFNGNGERWKDEKFITESMCLPLDQKLNASMLYGATGFSFLKIYMTRCTNNTVKKDCFPKEQIDATLNSVNVMVRFKNIYFDHDQLEEPSLNYIHLEGPIGSSTMNKRISYIFRNADYDTDAGIFLPAFERKTYSILTEVRESSDLRSDTNVPSTFISFNFQLNTISMLIQKRYYKFQNMLADLGGLLKGAITIASFFNWFFCHKLYYNEIINANINSLIESQDNLSSLGNNKKNFSESINKRHISTTSRSVVALSPVGEGCEKSKLRGKSPPSLKKNKNEKINKNEKSKTETTTGNTDLKSRSNSINAKMNKTKNFRKMIFKIDVAGLIFPMCCLGSNSTTRKQVDTYSKFKRIIDTQLDILTLINKINIVDKVNFFISGKNNMHLIENCVNPYTKYEKDLIPEQSEVNECESQILARFKNEI